ncbi:unnamed protein product [Kuraishia capsulata CBS 1993]|uniref:Peptidase C45 hydrolase domain-containing protein n=1 Tax=Kuraishia capsulata CBS 1993 TaxID=1382522 RepID=W6MIK5_9ASCO|nr:uncharacterized protein KUCA_T00001718001 [Kuraishia capsulata CBS 1993]CDK25748.1 unnamed protein product [Kuraishia capsulata CBS 1993]
MRFCIGKCAEVKHTGVYSYPYIIADIYPSRYLLKHRGNQYIYNNYNPDLTMNTVEPLRFYDSILPYAKCTGSNYDIGFTHGKVGAKQIRHCMKTYKNLYKIDGGIEWPDAIAKTQLFVPVLKEKCPDLYEELQGVADGSGFSLEDVVALNCRSEICLTTHTDGCTSVSQINPDNGDLFIAQNWDWVGEIVDGLMILDIEKEGKPRMIMVAEAGIIGKYGFNSSGLGLVMNAIMSTASDFSHLPIHLAIRKCLECETFEEAYSSLQDNGVASCVNLMIADKSGKFGTIECSPVGFVPIQPVDGQSFHTNHLFGETKFVKDFPQDNSIFRLNRVKELSVSAPATANSIRERLSDTKNAPYSICGFLKPGTGIGTFVTVDTIIVNVNTGVGELSIGKPCDNPTRYKLFFE